MEKNDVNRIQLKAVWRLMLPNILFSAGILQFHHLPPSLLYGLWWPCRQSTQLLTGGSGFETSLAKHSQAKWHLQNSSWVQYHASSHSNYTSGGTKAGKSNSLRGGSKLRMHVSGPFLGLSPRPSAIGHCVSRVRH